MSDLESQTARGGSVVSVVACETYDLEVVRQALNGALAPLGGMRQFVRPGMRVLLKPNLLKAVHWEHGITTHPAVIQAVAELVVSIQIVAGAERRIGRAVPIDE